MKKNSKTLNYYLDLKYNIIIEYVSEDQEYYFVAFCHELGRGSCFGIGENPGKAVDQFEQNRIEFIKLLYDKDMLIPEPIESNTEYNLYSGIFNVRTSPALHGKLVKEAQNNGISLNLFVNQLLSRATEESFLSQIMCNNTEKVLEKIDELQANLTFHMTKYDSQELQKNSIRFAEDWTPQFTKQTNHLD